MRLKVVNPNTTESMTQAMEAYLRRQVTENVEILCESARFGVNSVECRVDACLAAPAVIESVLRGEREESIDGYIIACFDDPGLEAAREITCKPVIGIGEAAIMTARLLAPSFSIVTILDRSKNMNEKLVAHNGATQLCRSIRSTGMGVLDFKKEPERGLRALREQAEKALEEDGAQCILLGCAGFVDFVEALRKELGVPVLDGVLPAVKYAQVLVSMGLTTSKINTWKEPEPKEYVGYDGLHK